MEARKSTIVVISSHVARGSVGNRAAVFALEALRHPVWSVPTVLLPWHPGHGPAGRIVPEEAEFSRFVDELARSPWLGEVGAVLSGYLGRASQAPAIARFVSAVKNRNPDSIYVCDPVMGDFGGLYVPKAVAVAIREHLLPLADIATPNLFELEWLSGCSAGDLKSAIAAARRLARRKTLVTSVGTNGGGTGNLLVTADRVTLACHETIDSPPNGLGDLTSALFLARTLERCGDGQALAASTASVLAILRRTVDRRADELTLETDADCLRDPAAVVDLQELV